MLLVVAFVLGMTLFKHFDFQTLTFKMPVLDTIFLITFAGSIYMIVRMKFYSLHISRHGTKFGKTAMSKLRAIFRLSWQFATTCFNS